MAKITPIKAIRAKCLECSCGSFFEIANCPIKKCALYAYRFGHRPKDEEIYVESVAENKTADSTALNEQKGDI